MTIKTGQEKDFMSARKLFGKVLGAVGKIIIGAILAAIILNIIILIVWLSVAVIGFGVRSSGRKPVSASPLAPEQEKEKKVRTSLLAEEKKINIPGFRFVDRFCLGRDIWAVGHRGGCHGEGCLIHSPDAGESWEIIWQNPKADSFKVHFFSRTSGLMATDSAVLRTEDGGRTWGENLIVANLPGFFIKIIKGFSAENRFNVSVRLRGAVNCAIETRNGGIVWEYVVYHGRHYGSRTIKFRSADQGRTWQ